MSGSNLRKIELLVETMTNSRDLGEESEYFGNQPGSSNQMVEYFNSGPLFSLNDFDLNEEIDDEVDAKENENNNENEGEEDLVESEWNTEWERGGNNSSENEFDEPARSYHNPFIDRPERHPVNEVHDISLFALADYYFKLKETVSDDPLAPNRVFSSKAKLYECINNWHIQKNIQVRPSQSSKSRLEVKCLDEMCKWRLYAKPTGVEGQWVIVSNFTGHSCFA